MTVTRTQLQIFLERAPSQPFDDDSEPRFRVVAALGQGATRRHVVPLTRAHDTAEDAMRVFADKVRHACTDDLARALVNDACDAADRVHDRLERQVRDLDAATQPLVRRHEARQARVWRGGPR